MPVEGATVYVAPVGDTRNAGSWAQLEGRAFFADGLPSGDYALYLHFGNCCGIVGRAHVTAGRVSIVNFSLAQYYSQTFQQLASRSSVINLAVAPSGKPWFVESLGIESRLGTIDLNGQLQEFDVPGAGESIGPSIAPAADGSVWFYNTDDQQFERLDPKRKIIRYGERGYFQGNLAVGPDGSLWALAWDGSKLYHINPLTRRVHAYEIPHSEPGSENAQMSVLDDGSLIYTSLGTSSVSRIDDNGQIVTKKIGSRCEPHAPQEWAGQVVVSCWAGRYRGFLADPHLNTLSPIDIGAIDSPMPPAAVVSADKLWFGSEKLQGFVGVDRSGHQTFLPYKGPIGIDVFSSGDLLWLIDDTSKLAVSISMGGAIAKYPLPSLKPTSGGPPISLWLLRGSSGNLWFTGYAMSIFEIRPGFGIKEYSVSAAPVRMPQ